MDDRHLAHLRAAILLALGSATQAQEATPTPPAADDDLDSIVDEVVVTGTRVAARTRLESLAPVDVLSHEALTSQGTTELAEALSDAAPSLNFPRPSITDGTDHIRPATLRGLAPDQTLVLVNSKRRHPSALVNVNGSVGRGSAAVDLNAIPLAAIESVEVLRDGASAQYGSDAIAGVINLRLRDAREGGSTTVTYGEYNTDVETERGQRHATDGGTLTASAWVGLPLGAEGFLTLTGEYRDRDPTSRGDFDNRVPGSPVTSRYGDANVEDITAYVNAGVPLSDTWNIYGWAGYQKREGDSAAFPRIFNDVRNVPAIYPNGFLPLITTDIDDVAVGWGVRGKLGGWDSDVSLVYGLNEVDYGVEHSLNTSYGAASQTSFDAGAMKYDQLVFNAGIVRSFDVGSLPEGINVALGIEARMENYSIDAGEPTSYDRGPIVGVAAGSQGFPGFQPSNEVDEDREAYSAYVDVEAQADGEIPHIGRVARRGLFGLRLRRHRQGRRTLRLHRRVRAARRGVHGFPCAGTAAGVLHVHRDQLHHGRAVRSGHLPRDLGSGDHAGRATARRRGVGQLFARHGASLRWLRSDHRCVSHRHRQSHRALGKPQHAAGRGADRAVRRDRGAVLHQRRRDQDRRHRSRGALPVAHRKRSAGSNSLPPATGTTPKSKRCRPPMSSTTSAWASPRRARRPCCSRASTR